MSVEVLSVRGLRPESRQVDRDLWLWFCKAKKESEEHGPQVTKRIVQDKARKAFQDAGIFNFKASDGWYFRWLRRWHRVKDVAPTPRTLARRKNNIKTDQELKTKSLLSKANRDNFTASGLSNFSPVATTWTNGGKLLGKSLENLSASNAEHKTEDFDGNLPAQDTLPWCNLQAEPSLETAHIDGHFASDASDLLSLDDFAWNDLTDLSCFAKPASSKQTLSSGVVNVPELCFNKISTKQHSSVKGKGNLRMSQKITCTVPGTEVTSDVLHKEVLRGGKMSTRVSGKGVFPTTKCSSTPLHHSGKRPDFSCRDIPLSDSRLEKFTGITKRDNHINHIYFKEPDKVALDESYSDLMRGETVGGSLVHHDLEDVSVSSDFVNQLNDEHLLDINLECGYDQGSPEPECHAVVDDDFSSEDNDYISEAVMLSMQEDDFSILNCEHSPFQGTISVIDENSQPESEKVKDLEVMQIPFTSEQIAVDSGEIAFPPMNVSSFNSNHGEAYESSEKTEIDEMAKTTENILLTDTHIQTMQPMSNLASVPNVSLHFAQEEGFVGQTGYLVSSFLQDNQLLTSVDLNDTFCVNTCDEGDSPSRLQELLPVSPMENVHVSNHLSTAFNAPGGTLDNFNAATCSGLTGKHGNDYHLSSVGEIAFVENQNLLQASPAQDMNTFVTGEDVYIAPSCRENEVNTCSSLFFSERVKLGDSSTAESSSLLQNSEDLTRIYFVPCTPEQKSCSVNDVQFEPSTFLHCNSSITDTNKSIGTVLDTHVSENIESRTVWTTPSSHVVGNTMITSSDIEGKEQCNTPFSTTSLEPLSGDTSLECSSFSIIESSSSPINESSKENKFSSFDATSVKSAVSDQDKNSNNRPKIEAKVPKRSTAYLTEKGNCNSKGKSSVDNSPVSYRRSSGDRYFPYFKDRVANYAIKHTAKEAARYFGVNVDTITMWTRARLETDTVVKNFPDQVLLQWLKKNREGGILLSREQVFQKALQLLRTPGNWLTDKNRWFHVWASRLVSEEEKISVCSNLQEGKESQTCKDKKALYPEEFKVEVALYAEQTSKNLASNIFKIARKRVFEWSAALKVSKNHNQDKSYGSNLSEASSTVSDQGCKPAIVFNPLCRVEEKNFKLSGKNNGRAVTSAAVDNELWLWFCEQTANKRKPKSKDIRAKAVELFRAHNHLKIQCSHGWLKKWSLRYGIALRHEGDSDLVAWCLKQFDCNRNISHRDLLSYAHESLTGTHKSEFKASAGWLVRFCKRHRNLLSTKPSIDMEIPISLQQSVSKFRADVQNMVHSSQISLDNIGCVDEIPLNFTAGGSRSQLLLRRSGFENCHALVVLSCLANGELLPPAVIFKGEGPPEEVTSNGVSLFIFYDQDCCMSTSIMLEWLDRVWARNVSSPSILVADSYDPHCSEEFKESCNSRNISLVIIPPGCSFKLQPLDLSVSRLFEATVNKRWMNHFSSTEILSTFKRNSYSGNSDIINWAAEAFKNLKMSQKEAVKRSFLVTGLTSALNGTDDHYIEDPSCIPVHSTETA